MTTMQCKNKHHVIKEAYSLKETDVPFSRVVAHLGQLPGETAMSAVLYWLFSNNLEWSVKSARIQSINEIPSSICSSCKGACQVEMEKDA